VNDGPGLDPPASEKADEPVRFLPANTATCALSAAQLREVDMSDAIAAAIEDHRRTVRVVKARRLWKRRLARALWAIDDDIDTITEGPEEWDRACADLEAAEEAREQAMLRLTNTRPRDLDSAATWIVYLTSLGKEGPSLAQIAATCAIKAKIRRRRVIRGPDRWFQRPGAD
jgi:hypothetical protein